MNLGLGAGPDARKLRGASDSVHMVIDAQINDWISNLLERAAGGYAAPRSAASGASVTS
jgi:hypothetical protein